MKTDAIKEIGIDADGRLIIKPATVRFLHIWRSGAEVQWDDKQQALFSPKPREWSYLDWYRHIIEVAKDGDGGGVVLQITPSTEWNNVSDELKQQILMLTY
ncbi:hypothetical protein [Hymenobacter sedentarius]|uniref:hypothetical protein n=1 Tax=Hymenobacter sedentarius TaxID=1411621 RepID=UPI0012FD1A8C|nr:hypothetical protein [Hymenobacter sedentarius]